MRSFVFAVICKCSFTAFMGFSLYHQEVSPREKIGLREKRPVYPSGYVNFTKGIFRPIIRLKLMGSWFPERSANFNSVLSRENYRTLSSLGVSPLQYSAWFSLRQSCVALLTFQTIKLCRLSEELDFS